MKNEEQKKQEPSAERFLAELSIMTEFPALSQWCNDRKAI